MNRNVIVNVLDIFLCQFEKTSGHMSLCVARPLLQAGRVLQPSYVILNSMQLL